MRKLSLAAVIALVLAVASVTLASASASSDTQTSDTKSTQVIHLVARTVQDANLDLGEPGDSLGDQFIFSDDLFRGGRKVGHDGGVCTLVRLVPRVSATLQCVITLSLPTGQITIQGLPTFADGPGSFLFAITGGTGAYKTAHGQVKVVEVSDVEARLTLFLIL
jgi:type II secretory pathway pseudopilin PulG